MESSIVEQHPESLDFAAIYNRPHRLRLEQDSKPATILGCVVFAPHMLVNHMLGLLRCMPTLHALIRPSKRLLVAYLRRIKIHSFIKLLITLSIGVLVGCLAVGLASVTEALKEFKNATSRAFIHDGRSYGILRATLFHSGYSAALILVGSALVRCPILDSMLTHLDPTLACCAPQAWCSGMPTAAHVPKRHGMLHVGV